MISFSWLDTIDILIVAALVFMVIRFFTNTKSIPMLTGLMLILILAVVSNILNLPTMKIIMHGLRDLWIIVFIIIFQPEIRRFRLKLVPKTLIAFTNKQVIILEDLINSPYGWIITYFQKNREIDFQLKRKNSIVSILNLDFGNGSPDENIQFRFEEENANRFLEYWDKLN